MATIWEMLEEHRKINTAKTAVRPEFRGVEGYDVYNPTSPFSYNGKRILCARVEKRDSEISQAVFFEEKEKDIYYVIEGWKKYALQDPSITKVSGYYILGGTEVFPHPDDPARLCWHTTFFYGAELENLKGWRKGLME